MIDLKEYEPNEENMKTENITQEDLPDGFTTSPNKKIKNSSELHKISKSRNELDSSQMTSIHDNSTYKVKKVEDLDAIVSIPVVKPFTLKFKKLSKSIVKICKYTD